MTDQGYNDLMSALGTIAAELQSLCITKTGMNKVQCPANAQRQWGGTPLRIKGEFAGVDLSSLPRRIYSGGLIWSRSTQQGIWDDAVAEMSAGRSVADMARKSFPSLDFSRSAPTALVQLLCCLSWSGEKFEVTKLSASLKVGDALIGIDNRAAIGSDGKRTRLPSGRSVNPADICAMPQGRNRPAAKETVSLFHHLMAALPELAPELEVIFSTAVTLGREFETKLTEMFFIVPFDALDVSAATVWASARRLVTEATMTPNEALWELLRGSVTYNVFTRAFGIPRARVAKYSALLRGRHLTAINRFESGLIDTEVKEKAGNPEAVANSLLQLQTMMGSWK